MRPTAPPPLPCDRPTPAAHPRLLGFDRGRVFLGDNLPLMRRLPGGCCDLIYLDPPFNTGRARTHQPVRTTLDADGDRTGFQGRRYRTTALPPSSYPDRFDDYLGFLRPRLRQCRRLLAPQGTLYVHLDPREAHYVKVLLDGIFGRDGFLNEIVWAYDYGGRPRRRWAPKHDTLLVYVRSPGQHYLDLEAVDRIPYLAPGLVGAAKAARGKVPTDTWWHTIVPTRGSERVGYPTQKPLGILRRIIQASAPPGGLVADFFAGSGTTGVAAAALGRRFILADILPEAVAVQRRRLVSVPGVTFPQEACGPWTASSGPVAPAGILGASGPIAARGRAGTEVVKRG